MQPTANAIRQINSGSAEGFEPVLQVISIRSLPSGQKRYRLVVSDGAKYQTAMLATQQNKMVEDGALQENCFVKLGYFMVNQVQGKEIIIIIKLEVVGTGDAIVGSPVDWQTNDGAQKFLDGGAAPATAAAAPSPAPGAPAPMDVSPAPPKAMDASPAPKAEAPMPNYGMMGNSAPVARMDSDIKVVPIASLNPYQNRWTIKARVTSKGSIRRWSNARGEGHLFSVDLLDAHGGEIRGTFFKDACDKFEPILQEGKVYTLSGGRLKVANQQYTSLRNNYEITFDRNADIRPAADGSDIMRMRYSFRKISSITEVPPNTTIDVVAVVKSATECTSIMSQKLSKELFKRDLTLIDDSLTEIRITLWGDRARQEGPWARQPVVAFKGIKVSDYNGRTLGTYNSSGIAVDPEGVPEADALAQWWSQNSGSVTSTSISETRSGGGGGAGSFDERKPLSAIKDENLGVGQVDYFTAKATVTYVKSDPAPWYTACPDELYKVTETTEGTWFCEKNNQTYPTCKRRFIMSCVVTDHSGNSWLTAYNDEAEKILNGRTADDLYALQAAGDENAYKEAFSGANFTQLLVRIKVRTDTRDDEQRVRSSIAGMYPLDYQAESRNMISFIKKHSQVE